ncbi:arylsulfatase [Algibacter lectus]|uniref:arylsulfatase n=1 Tax=Algibacter lectus TaxID=221126 RepID=UPI000945C932|nr:arylsulfatase [Algibacter lectus]
MAHTSKNIFLAFCPIFFCFMSQDLEAQTKPNVILIVTDDQGFGDLGYYGNPHVKTPTIDRFAKESVRFDEFLVSPVCAPTRAALMTGRYSLRTGVRDTYRGGAIMATNEITIAEMLKAAGYKTGMIGKWHLGDNYPSRPQDQGFDFTLNHLSGGIGQGGDWPNALQGNRRYFDPILWKNGEMVETKGYCSDVFTDEAIHFVEENKANPFFLYLSFNAPHAPLQVPDEYYNMYKDIDPSKGFENDDRPFPVMDEKMKENARKVYAMVSNIDDNLKRLFQNLENIGIKDNTLVIFMTDNGHQHDRYAAGMRGRKSYVYEGGVRVPSFWSLPSQFKGNRDIKTPAAHYDVLPTLAELCHAPLPNNRILDGKSLLPLLNNETSNLENRTFARSWVRGGPEKYTNISIRKNQYKLVGNTEQTADINTFELYNIIKDPYEQDNMVTTHPIEAQSLKNEIDTWFNAMVSEKNFITEQPAIIGTIHENPTVLNINDAVFTRNKQLNQDVAAWKIDVAQAGVYNIKIQLFQKNIDHLKLLLKIGDVEINKEIPSLKDGIIYIEKVTLEKGSTTLIPFITNKKGFYIKPFYTEIGTNIL